MIIIIIIRHTFLPARLLCKFIKLRASPSISLASRNFLENFIPKPISAEHPPHFHAAWFWYVIGVLCSGSQPHKDMLPLEHAAVIECTAPALDIA